MYPNLRMVPASGKAKTESLNAYLTNFILDNEAQDGTDDALPDIRYTYAIDTIRQVNEIIDYNILIRKTFLFTQGEDGEFIRSQVKVCAAQFDQDQEMLLVSLCEVQATDVMTHN